jgi:FKBP-type peptidyl-prolyl cis-trans isomerase FklB
MKLKWMGAAVLAGAIAGSVYAQQSQQAQQNSPLKTDKEKVSYAIGMTFGSNLKKQGVEFDPNMLLQGIKDATGGGKTLLTDAEVKEVLTNYQKQLVSAKSDKNLKEGEAFLAANKTKQGVVTLPSGLQYKVLKQGTGPKPKATDTVVTNYRGTTVDGTEFDSSYSRNEPAEFPVNGVIPAWTEALQLMPVGSKWQLFVPAKLAYGERGAGGVIEPNSTLIFEVELLQIKGSGSAPQTQTQKHK